MSATGPPRTPRLLPSLRAEVPHVASDPADTCRSCHKKAYTPQDPAPPPGRVTGITDMISRRTCRTDLSRCRRRAGRHLLAVWPRACAEACLSPHDPRGVQPDPGTTTHYRSLQITLYAKHAERHSKSFPRWTVMNSPACRTKPCGGQVGDLGMQIWGARQRLSGGLKSWLRGWALDRSLRRGAGAACARCARCRRAAIRFRRR